MSREEETRRRRREKDKRKEEKLRRWERDIQKQRDELARKETDLRIRERQQSVGVPSRFHDFMRNRRGHHERENREHRDQESARAQKRQTAGTTILQYVYYLVPNRITSWFIWNCVCSDCSYIQIK